MANILNEHVDFSYKNAKQYDPFLANVSMVTLNENMLPLASGTETMRPPESGTFTGKVPPEYLTAEIELCYAGKVYKKIPILFPESASESLGANYIKENPIGSSNPILAFSHSNSSTISINFIALSDYLPQGYNTFADYLDAIRSMTKPQHTEDYVKGPEVRVHLANIYFEGVCDSINIDYRNVYGNDTFTIATIACQFTRAS